MQLYATLKQIRYKPLPKWEEMDAEVLVEDILRHADNLTQQYPYSRKYNILYETVIDVLADMPADKVREEYSEYVAYCNNRKTVAVGGGL